MKADVWADDMVVNAVQFHLASGHISPRYGIPACAENPTTFAGEKGSQLVGVYGRFGGVIDSLGFRFATVDNGVPSLIDGSWFEGTEEESASLVSLPK